MARAADAAGSELDRLALLTALICAAEAELRVSVLAARSTGTAWSRIACSLGVTKQAAAARFGSRRAV
jgi:hypothetical protein